MVEVHNLVLVLHTICGVVLVVQGDLHCHIAGSMLWCNAMHFMAAVPRGLHLCHIELAMQHGGNARQHNLEAIALQDHICATLIRTLAWCDGVHMWHKCVGA